MTGRAASVARLVLILAGLLTFGYCVSVVPGVRAVPGTHVVWDGWVYPTVTLLAAVVCVLRALGATDREPAAWYALTAGLVCVTLGDQYWARVLARLDDPPVPSFADGFWLAFYPCAYAAVVLLVRARVTRFHASMWLDGLVSGLACAAMLATVAFDTIVEGTEGKPLTVATNLAYPAGDLLLLILIVGVFGFTGWRPGRSWALFGAGLIAYGIADTAYLYRTATETYVEGSWIDALWPIGNVLFALAACQRPGRSEVRLDDWRALVVPSAATVLAVGVLVVCAVGQGQSVAVGLAAGAVVAAVGRTFLTFSETRQLSETRLQALTDELTGLANRRAFMAELERSVAAGRPTALLLVDLDHFKELNDTLGHHVGDLLLARIGPRLDGVLRPNDVLARLGGDEFGVLLTETADADAALGIGERVRERLASAFDLDGVPVRIDGSIGVALYPAQSCSAVELLQHADVAMYAAKRDGSGVGLYCPERDRSSTDRLALLGDLREGIARGELELRFQPQANLADGAIVGVEALVRWRHPIHGLLLPGRFLPAVEQTSVMRPLTERVLSDVLAWAQRRRAIIGELPVSVNVAAPNLLDLAFPATVRRLLTAHDTPAELLRLEITENAVMVDADRASVVLAELRELGVTLSLDDFGTGHSSLERLKGLPVDELKIDKSFVLQMDIDGRDAAIVEAAVTLGRRLGLTVVAEGVEEPSVWSALQALGCDRAQGYLLAEPLTAPDLETLIVAWRHDPPTWAKPAQLAAATHYDA